MVITLRTELHKVRLALLTLNANVSGQQGADAFIALQLQAKEQERAVASATPETIVLS